MVDDAISVAYQGKPGWCTLPAFILNKSLGGRTLGAMIVSGRESKNQLYYCPVTQESLLAMWPSLAKRNAIPEISPDIEEASSFCNAPPAAIVVGKLRSGSHQMFKNSNLKRTFINCGPDTKTTPVFGIQKKTIDGEERTFNSNIYFEAKLNKVEREPNMEGVKAFNKNIHREFPSPVIERTSLTLALRGNAFVNPVSKDTSLGFGLKGVKGKFPYVTSSDSGLEYGEGEEEKLTGMIDDLNTGDAYLDCVYQIHRKDEKLDKKDVYPPRKDIYLVVAPPLSGKTHAHDPEKNVYDAEQMHGYVNEGISEDIRFSSLAPNDFRRFKKAVSELPEGSVLLVHDVRTAARLGMKVSAMVIIPEKLFQMRVAEVNDFRAHHATQSRNRAKIESVGRKVLTDIDRAVYYCDTKSKQRLMFGSPWYFTILFRFAFMEFLTAMYSRFGSWPITVGMTERSSDWTRLFNYMMLADPEGKPNLGGSDCPGWDVEAAYKVMAFVYGEIIKWYEFWKISPENRRLREALIEATLKPMFVWKGFVILLPFILPSGHIFTNLLGGLMNWVESRTNLGTLARREGYNDSEILEIIFHKVRFAFNGDDRIFTVCRSLPWYNQLAERDEYILNFQRCPTPPQKDHEMTEYLDPESFQFNSRRFHPFGNSSMQLAPLDLNTVLQIPKWSFSPSRAVVTQQVVMAMRELFHHGREVYDEWVPQLIRELKLGGAATPNLSYEAIMEEWLLTFS